MHFNCVYACAHAGGCTCHTVVWRFENNSYDLVLSFNYVGLEDLTQVTRLSVRCLYPLSYLTGPGFCALYSDSLGCMNLEKPLAKQGSRTTEPCGKQRGLDGGAYFIRHLFYLACGLVACDHSWSRNFVCAGRCLCALWLARGSLYLSAHHSRCRRLLDCVLPTSEEDPGLSSPWFFKSAHHSNRHSFS